MPEGQDLKQVIVAIDGPAGAGKSTIARRVAARLGFLYVDTGALYRALGLNALRTGTDPGDASAMETLATAAQMALQPNAVLLNGEDITEDIRTPEVSRAASKVSAIPGVRRALLGLQRRMAEQQSVVMEGRDIGTVVFPRAQVKIFLDASSGVRANRRVLEMREKEGSFTAEQVARDMEERDRRDRTRAEAPLKMAPDAVYLDTSGMDLDAVEQAVVAIIRQKAGLVKETE